MSSCVIFLWYNTFILYQIIRIRYISFWAAQLPRSLLPTTSMLEVLRYTLTVPQKEEMKREHFASEAHQMDVLPTASPASHYYYYWCIVLANFIIINPLQSDHWLTSVRIGWRLNLARPYDQRPTTIPSTQCGMCDAHFLRSICIAIRVYMVLYIIKGRAGYAVCTDDIFYPYLRLI